jgi:hypothetical protein
MPARLVRSLLAITLCIALLALPGCQRAKAGTKCRVGAAPARDATYVLLCVKGRWKRSLTVAQATRIGNSIPVKIEAASSTDISVVASDGSGNGGVAAELAVRVTAFTGVPLVGGRLHWSVESGPNGVDVRSLPLEGPDDSITAQSRTNVNGVATIGVVSPPLAGGYVIAARIDGLKDAATFNVTVLPAEQT